MEYLTMAQACGEEPIREYGWSPEDVADYFGDDEDAARESFAYSRNDALVRENEKLRAEIAELRGQ